MSSAPSVAKTGEPRFPNPYPSRITGVATMARYIVQRLLLLPILLVIFSFIVFALVQAPPGDFLTSYIATLASSGSSMDDAGVAALKQQFGVDQPFMVQYGNWMKGLLHTSAWRRTYQ